MHYTDIYCHILPCIDDGPSSNEGSLKMARELSENGFNHVIATPHYIDDLTPDYFRKVEKQYKLMLALIKQNDIPLKLSLGGEVMLNPYLPALAANNLLPTFNNTNYVLIETSLHQPLPYYAKEIFFNLLTLAVSWVIMAGPLPEPPGN